MVTYKKAAIHFFSIFMILFVCACHDSKESDGVFKKEKPVQESPAEIWLGKNKNYLNSKNYLDVFYSNFNSKIAQKDYLGATKILDIVSLKLAYFYDYNPKFVATIQEFNAKYRNKVSVLKTTFVDSYLANYYYDKGDFKKSCTLFKKITILEPNDYKSCNKIARACYELSYVYFNMGKQNLSLIANQKALEYFNKTNNIDGIGSVYSNYANIYKAIGNQKKAIQYANKAIAKFKSINNTYDTYMGLYNKISVYDYAKDTRKGALIDSICQAFVESKYDSDVLKIALYDYKVEHLVQKNKLTEAKKILDELKPIVEKVNSDNWTQDYNATLAQYEIKINPNYSDIDVIKNAIPNLKENEQYEKADLFFGVLKKHAIENNDYKKALYYEEEKQIIADSLGNIAARQKIAELDTKYQTDKKTQQIVLQKKTILNNKKTIALLISGLIGFLLFIIAFTLFKKQKQLKQEKQNSQIYTKQLLEKTEEERKRIASDLHDSVSHELLSLKNSFEQKTDTTNKKIDQIINDIRSISRNLHPVMFDKIGLKASIEQLVERAETVNDFMVTANIDYNASLTTSEELQIYRIIQEALSNIIKYANAVAARITVSDKNDTIFIEIKDNGKGFNVAETLNSTNAFGLHNIIERSKTIGGEARIVSDKKGTIVTVEIKKA